MRNKEETKMTSLLLLLFSVVIFLLGLSLGTNFYLMYRTESLEKQRDTAVMEAVAERNHVYLLEEFIAEELGE